MRRAGRRAGPAFTSFPEEQEPIYLVLVVYRAVCIHRLFKWPAWFSDAQNISLCPHAPTEFLTKKMSGGEEKQGDRRRSAEGQCTKQRRKVKLRNESYCCCSSVNWMVLGGDKGGGMESVFEGNIIDELAAQPQWKTCLIRRYVKNIV